jgi:type II secretory pathway pseudopilin PulG
LAKTNRKSPRGFTLLEMLTTVAALIVVLGLMVSLARYVRNELAVEVTKDLLHRLDSLTQQYIARHNQLPKTDPFIPPTIPPNQPLDEQTLQQSAIANNRSIVSALRLDGLLQDQTFAGLPQSIYNDILLRDAWGSPIVFMPSMHEGIQGMALENKPFFFSAGPDQRYLTFENNLYSYEK